MTLLIILGIVTAIALGLSFWAYTRFLPRTEASKSSGNHLVLWIALTVISIVLPFMPANLIFALFYEPPQGVDFNALHLGLSTMLFIPVINAVLLLLLTPVFVRMKIRRNKIA